jgi:predicted XRE-type DNA-binding protein
MTRKLELVHGSGNVFRDLGHPNADVEQMKAILAAQIILALDARKLTGRAAQELTGVTAADFSRIRRVKLDRFTIDRLVTTLNKLDRRVNVSVSVRRRAKAGAMPATGWH